MKNLIRISAAFGLLVMLCAVAPSQSKSPIIKEDLVGEYSYSHTYGGSTIEIKPDRTFQSVSSNCTHRFLN